jgi:hypothetical protein
MRASKIACLVLLLAGCQHIQLENHTLRQAGTLSDLQYKQVLDNLAMFAANADALPYFSATGTGQTNITMGANSSTTFNWDLAFNMGKALLWYFDKASTTGGATESSIEQWTTASVLNPDELSLMQCAYQRTVGATANCNCEEKLKAFFGHNPERMAAMHPGWFHVTRKCDVPRHACFVGHYCNTYVWVTAEELGSLTNLTLAILDIATALPTARIDPQVAQVKDLQDRIKALVDILDKVNVKDTTKENIHVDPALKNNLVSALELELRRLYKLLMLLNAQEAVAMLDRDKDLKTKLLASIGGADSLEAQNFMQALRRAADLKGDVTAPPILRERKNLYNPFLIPNMPAP